MNTLEEIEAHYRRRCATPSDINEHLPVLRRYAERCISVAELGVRGMNSTWAFIAALAAVAQREDDRVPSLLCVDICHPDENGGNLAEAHRLTGKAFVHFDFLQADDLCVNLPEMDLLFIDTWHTYVQLAAELARHAPQARRYLILHDTTTFGQRGEDGGRGLWPAVTDYLSTGPGMEWRMLEKLENNNGLTVLGRKTLL